MRRKGDCWDSAPMESFFHTIKTERVHHRVYATRDQARRDLFGYIEGFYNPRRLHSSLGYISPVEAERRAAYPRRRDEGGRSSSHRSTPDYSSRPRPAAMRSLRRERSSLEW